MKTFLLRTFTAVFVVAIILFGILYSPFAFLAVFSILTFGVLFEYYTLINASREVSIYRTFHALAGVLLFVCTFFQASHMTSNWVFCSYMIYLIGMFVSRLYTKKENPIREVAHIFMGHIYIAGPLSLLNAIAFHTQAYPLGEVLKDYCPIFPLALFLFIWINDTGAYLTGMTCNKLMHTHKLFPRVSPKKTWEGFWGGMIFCVLLGLGLYYVTFWNLLGLDIHEGVRLTRLEWMGLGMVVSIFSTYGDLFESLVKRAVGVKDSGNLLPGHGGMWDRFDSLILATPGMLMYLILIALFH